MLYTVNPFRSKLYSIYESLSQIGRRVQTGRRSMICKMHVTKHLDSYPAATGVTYHMDYISLYDVCKKINFSNFMESITSSCLKNCGLNGQSVL